MIFQPPYFYREAYMHRAIHALDAPVSPLETILLYRYTGVSVPPQVNDAFAHHAYHVLDASVVRSVPQAPENLNENSDP